MRAPSFRRALAAREAWGEVAPLLTRPLSAEAARLVAPDVFDIMRVLERFGALFMGAPTYRFADGVDPLAALEPIRRALSFTHASREGRGGVSPISQRDRKLITRALHALINHHVAPRRDRRRNFHV